MANHDPLSADTITFDPSLIGGSNPGVDDGHLTLTRGELVIAGNVTVDGDVNGAGITIDAADASRVFNISSGTSQLNHLALTNGDAGYGGHGGGVSVGSALHGTSASVTISNSTVAGSAAYYGGGVSVDFGSSLHLLNSTVSGNRAGAARTVDGRVGGVYALQSDAPIRTQNTIIANNFDLHGNLDCGRSPTRRSRAIGPMPEGLASMHQVPAADSTTAAPRR